MSDPKLFTLHNDHLVVTASSRGAELQSVKLDGHEYLWIGDPAVWKRHSPVLFPFVGRFTDGHYLLHGREYPMNMHGFSQEAPFEPVEADDTHVSFVLRDTEDTYAIYPFRFSFMVSYTLSGTSVLINYTVKNDSDETMYFGLGAHPGFMVPMEEGLAFEDYYVEFPDVCRPDQVIMSDDVYVTGKREPYPLEEGRRFRLNHDLFKIDAVVLEHTGDSVCIRSDKGKRRVTVDFPQMPWVGFWHAAGKEAPYICVEPWVSLPSRKGVVEEFSARRDLVHLPAGGTYVNDWKFAVE